MSLGQSKGSRIFLYKFDRSPCSRKKRRQMDRSRNDDNEDDEEMEEENAEEAALSNGLKKGQWTWLVNKDIPAILTAWNNLGICLALSTRHSAVGSVVEGKVKGIVGRISRTCPELIKYYNDTMGGVDRADALRSHLTIGHYVDQFKNHP